MAGEHRLSCTSLGMQDHGVLVGASCRPSESAGLSAVRQLLCPVSKRADSSSSAHLLCSTSWERCWARVTLQCWKVTETAMSLAGVLSKMSRQHVLLPPLEQGDDLNYAHGCFSHIFVVGSGVLFLPPPLFFS